MLLNKKTCATCDNYDGWACKIDGFIMGSYADACKAYSAKRGADTGEPRCGTGEPDCGTSLLTGHSHKLAERIRMMYRWTQYIPFYVILQQAMREMLPEGTNYCEALADLIDRPTCTIIDSYQLITPGLEELDLDDMCRFKLSCGHDAYGYEEPKCCPECGAAIVNDR